MAQTPQEQQRLDDPGGSAEPAAGRGRIVFAAVTALALAAVVGVVAIASGGDEQRPVTAAPAGCVEAWNADPAARAYGRHNFAFHLYEGALVTHLDDAAHEAGPGEGRCAVVFPSEALDPEPFAAGQVLRRGAWVPISGLAGVDLNQVARLQVTAAGSPNTALDERGSLEPL